MGDIQILLPDGSVWLLENVQNIFDLKRNLIFVRQIDDDRHAILLLVVLGRLQKELEYWPVERRLVLYIRPQVQETQLQLLKQVLIQAYGTTNLVT